MNVLIITEEDVFYLYEFFRCFFALSTDAPYQLKAITVCAAFNKKSPFDLAKQMLGFYGPINFFRMGIWYAWRKITGKNIGTIARINSLELWETKNVNDPDYVNRIKKAGIDAIVSIAAPQIFKYELIAAAPKGCINSHSALLPGNRGMMPVFWAMYKGDAETGVTIHYINEKVDEGDIIRQVRVPIGEESLHEMILKTKRLSAQLIHETLCDMSAGTVKSTPMPKGGSYQTFPTPAQAREFERKGKTII